MATKIEPPTTFPPPVGWNPQQPFFSLDISHPQEPGGTSTVHVSCRNTHFFINVSSADWADSPHLIAEYQFLQIILKRLVLGRYGMSDFFAWACRPLLPTFAEINTTAEAASRCTVREKLFPETRVYDLKSRSGELVAEPSDSPAPPLPQQYGVEFSEDEYAGVPTYLLDEVYTENGLETLVLGDGTTVFCKMLQSIIADSHKRELRSYRKMHAAKFDDAVRVPQLLGLLKDNKNTVYGFLLSKPENEMASLANRLGRSPPPDLRKKWDEQITTTLEALHAAGISWGDAKPHNVIIDADDDAYLVEFGNVEFTDWVPSEFAGTPEGDLVGLQRMKVVLHYYGEDMYGDGTVNIEDHGECFFE
ncbi:kinase domain-containing protein [Pochonia chlamydosporia 170]|uniref:Kinase domain-containing protein n=1 Tax=Pochonia chlamydosporia 170 TaxID=1380566 RepID=A0A179G961_METCM|nr:kinase domain-containing protein [Pochonia chlamydosporia 170]OAQ73699.1 kinase domain-containing protein [Pochonia chlamydosporia 170]